MKTFPPGLESYRQWIEAARLTALCFEAKRGATLPWQSKQGGRPYFQIDHPDDWFYTPWPQAVRRSPWPKSRRSGRELFLLAQINFAEIPPVPFFPDRGILQVFLDVDGEPHSKLKQCLHLAWHETVFTDPEFVVHDFGALDVQLPYGEPGEWSLTFHRIDSYLSFSDYRFAEVYAQPKFDGVSLAELLEGPLRVHYLQLCRPDEQHDRNQIGGYHYSQNDQDPRGPYFRRSNLERLAPEWNDSLLLIQFASTDVFGWGDGGEMRIFIQRDDLAQRRFDNILAHWDST
jgi:uncharacterized protein YwqG